MTSPIGTAGELHDYCDPIAASPNALNFSSVVGGAAPAAQPVTMMAASALGRPGGIKPWDRRRSEQRQRRRGA